MIKDIALSSLSYVVAPACILRQSLQRRRQASRENNERYLPNQGLEAFPVKNAPPDARVSFSEVHPPNADRVQTKRNRGPRQGLDIRRCVVTRQRVPRQQLWRVVRLPNGKVSLDVGQGRSAYISRSFEAGMNAKLKSMLQKALKARVCKDIMHELHRRALELRGSDSNVDVTNPDE